MANEDVVVAKELRGRNAAELSSLLASKRDELHKAKFKKALGQLRETHRIKLLKKDIARIATVLQQASVEPGESR